jgi:hypothetical protein
MCSPNTRSVYSVYQTKMCTMFTEQRFFFSKLLAYKSNVFFILIARIKLEEILEINVKFVFFYF